MLLLAACNQERSEQEPAQQAPSPEEIAGTYEATLADGSTIRHTLNADGTYLDTDAEGNPVENGNWRLEGTQLCYDPEGSEPEACYDQGANASVKRIEAEAPIPE